MFRQKKLGVKQPEAYGYGLIGKSKLAQQSWENTVSEIRPTIGLSHQAAILDKKENRDGLTRYDRSEYRTVVREGHGTVEKETAATTRTVEGNDN
jgi:hypothetical protein